ncbi:MAG: HAD family phosphatase [Negativicutes bacterium]|jgi:2-haloacid dehalogenase
MNKINTILFDLGGVLIDWNPRYLYRKVWPEDDKKIEYFLENICNGEWNIKMDAGKPMDEAIAECQLLHSEDWHEYIDMWRHRWQEMLGDEITATADLLRAFHKEQNFRLLALTNWSAETFPYALKRYHFLRDCFEDIVVSGEIFMAKPDRDIFEYTINHFKLDPKRTLFIDDSAANVATAKEVGLNAIRYLNPEQLKKDLTEYGVLPKNS